MSTVRQNFYMRHIRPRPKQAAEPVSRGLRSASEWRRAHGGSHICLSLSQCDTPAFTCAPREATFTKTSFTPYRVATLSCRTSAIRLPSALPPFTRMRIAIEMRCDSPLVAIRVNAAADRPLRGDDDD